MWQESQIVKGICNYIEYINNERFFYIKKLLIKKHNESSLKKIQNMQQSLNSSGGKPQDIYKKSFVIMDNINMVIEFSTTEKAAEFYNEFLMLCPEYCLEGDTLPSKAPTEVILPVLPDPFGCKIKIDLSIQKKVDLEKLYNFLQKQESQLPESVLSNIMQPARSLSNLELEFYQRLNFGEISEDLLNIAKKTTKERCSKTQHLLLQDANPLWEFYKLCNSNYVLKIEALKSIPKYSNYYNKAQLELPKRSLRPIM